MASGISRPDTKAAVIAMTRAGFRQAEIVALFGGAVTERAVNSWLAEERAKDPSIPKFRAGRAQSKIWIPRDTLAALEEAAARRNTSPNEIARRLLTAAVADNLVEAVLDDGDEVERGAA